MERAFLLRSSVLNLNGRRRDRGQGIEAETADEDVDAIAAIRDSVPARPESVLPSSLARRWLLLAVPVAIPVTLMVKFASQSRADRSAGS